jgi:NitT/TauT family transport system ATP-binding protein
MSYLQLKNLSKSFASNPESSRLPVLDNISFSLNEREFTCLLGPSSCGKSTLLRIVDGLITPDSGEVTISDERVTGPHEGCGFVFQQFNLLPWRTALGNVEFALELRHVSRLERRERALKSLELVRLLGFERYYPAQLSGGMQQRVGLARAFVIEPRLLLMDEPFGSLDAQTREAMQDELMRIWAVRQCTVLFVTHDIEEAIFLSDRILVMSARPSSIVESISVSFPRPRDDTLRSSANFAHLRGYVSQTLKRASAL